MKILPLLLLLSLGMSQQQNTPVMQKGRQVLFDFRKDHASSSPRITAATQRMVLSKVFRKYLTDGDKCSHPVDASGDDFLAAARRAGQIVPSINDMVTGSFTAPGQTQTAYVIDVGECNASHAENFGSKRVAIFSGQQLVADMDIDFHANIVRKTDLDSDGIDELLMTTGDMAQGTVIEMATLFDFRNGRARKIEEFGTVVEDSCGSGSSGSASKASVLSISDIEPGKMPKLRIDNYKASCRTPTRWRFLSTGKMQD